MDNISAFFYIIFGMEKEGGGGFLLVFVQHIINTVVVEKNKTGMHAERFRLIG
jgi:hypothetical protein